MSREPKRFTNIDDLEIRASIPCYTVLLPEREWLVHIERDDGTLWEGYEKIEERTECLPVGYTLDDENCVYFRGLEVRFEKGPRAKWESDAPGNRLRGAEGAWEHAVWVEKVLRGIAEAENGEAK